MLAEKLIELRKSKGWTQQDLSDKTGIPRPMISRYEIDTTPGKQNLKKILDAFGLPKNYFFQIAVENTNTLNRTSDPVVNRMISDLLELPKEDQKLVYSMIQTIKERHRPKRRIISHKIDKVQRVKNKV